MLTYISTIDEIENEAGEIESFLTIVCSEDPNECTERGSQLAVYIARSGKLLADAKYHQDEAVQKSAIAELGKSLKIAPSVLTKIISASTKRENYTVNRVERLNRASVHQLDWMRTLISKAKEEMKFQGYVNH